MEVQNTTRFPAYALIVATLFTLMGCSSPVTDKTARVKMETTSYTLVFEGKKTRLSKAQFEGLDSFVRSVPVLAINYAGIEADSSNSVAMARVKKIKNYLIKHGVAQEAIHLQPATGNDKNTITLNIQYAKAAPQTLCPDWSENPVVNYKNTTFSNFGCAYNNNIAVQLANPEDLEKGHGQPAISGARDSVILQNYMANTPPPSAGASGSSSSSSSSSSSTGGASH